MKVSQCHLHVYKKAFSFFTHWSVKTTEYADKALIQVINAVCKQMLLRNEQTCSQLVGQLKIAIAVATFHSDSVILVTEFYSGQDIHTDRQHTCTHPNPRQAESQLWPTIMSL